MTYSRPPKAVNETAQFTQNRLQPNPAPLGVITLFVKHADLMLLERSYGHNRFAVETVFTVLTMYLLYELLTWGTVQLITFERL